jgi:protein tyrosine phosphatase (PTP) superfamily phosphohydrolase (DUF442 family)
MKKKPFQHIITVVFIIVVAVLLVRHFYIRDFRIIAPEVLYVSGQPRGMDYMRLLYKYHIATIINVRPTSEHREINWHSEELIWTREHAVKYVEMPIEKQKYFPDQQIQDQLFEVMGERRNLPVLLHGSGDDKRVAMLVAAWLRKKQGLSVDETLVQVKKVIDERPLTPEEISFINSL